MTTFADVSTDAKVEARKRVYVALSTVKRLLADLDIVPNMRDYHSLETFTAARQIHAGHVRTVVALQDAMTGECRFLRGR